MPARMPILLLPLALLLLQGGLLVLWPAVAGPAAYVIMVVAPLLAALACGWRAHAEAAPARVGWAALAVSLAVWSVGAFGNLWQELVVGRAYEMYPVSTLAFNLSAVPLAFLLAGEWRERARPAARVLDGVLALALGYAYFRLTWAMLNERDTPDAASIATMVWLEDAQNLFILAAAVLRWLAAETPTERAVFRSLSAYALVYMALIFGNNHFLAGDPAYGAEHSSVITVAFALLATLALHRSAPAAPRLHGAALARAVSGGRPMLLAGVLLIVSLFLIRVDYAHGSAGVLIAVAGYALRNAVVQVRHIERGDRLKRERSALQAIAWTDALTGIPNRHYLDQALAGPWARERRAHHPLSVLMIDIDHFKALNDRYGHPAGDACLREVARRLQEALGRPDDVLARYGGEEFIALLHDADAAGAQAVAERLRAAVEALAVEHAGSPFGVVTVSIGAASAAQHGETARLIAAADKALYEAKCAGRNRVAHADRARLAA